MPKYTEDRSVEQPAIDLFQQLNWETYNAYDEVLGEEGDLSRETTEEIGRNPLSRGDIPTKHFVGKGCVDGRL
jgi:type I restriction enzyme, R subunit